MDITLKEVEVLKLNLRPDEVLVVKMKGLEFLEPGVLESFRSAMKQVVPNNQVLVLGLPPDHDIVMETITKEQASEIQAPTQSPCSVPKSYCDGCSCGKKEAVLAELEGK